jgi:hypothetical protein
LVLFRLGASASSDEWVVALRLLLSISWSQVAAVAAPMVEAAAGLAVLELRPISL